MPNFPPDALAAMEFIQWGARVDRLTAALPQTTHSAIFNVLVGRVLIHQIIGQVTTIIQALANATKLTSYPTVGSAVDLCATVDINGLEVGGLLSLNGTLATALGKTNAGAAAASALADIVAVGAIHLDCAASATGSVKWSCFYVPLDDGAYMTAA